MPAYTNREFFDMLLMFAKADKDAAKARKMYKKRYPKRRTPTKTTIIMIDQRLRMFGSFKLPSFAKPGKGTYMSFLRQKLIAEHFQEDPEPSIAKTAKLFQTSPDTVKQVLRCSVYRRHIVPCENRSARITFCDWLLSNLNKNILWTDEAIFTDKTLYTVHDVPWRAFRDLQEKIKGSSEVPFSITVWAGFINNKLLGPYFSKSHLTESTYLITLKKVIEEMCEEIPLSLLTDLHIQKSSIPTLYEKQVHEYLNEFYINKWIGRGGPIAWPDSSQDLSPLIYYIWNEIKISLYVINEKKINCLEELKDRITLEFKNINDDKHGKLSHLTKNLQKRAECCISRNGDEFNDILNII